LIKILSDLSYSFLQASALSASPIFRGADDKFEEDVRVLLTSMKKLLEDMVRQRATLVVSSCPSISVLTSWI
jgi:hypothetical protein